MYRKRRWLFAFSLLIIGLYVFYLTAINQQSRPENFNERYVYGDLGGVVVAIPAEFARFVEYNGSPHFMEKSWFKSIQRTNQTKLRSFGFEVRYPDMASDKERTEPKDIYTSTWMRVGVKAGEDYGDEHYLHRRKERYINPKLPCFSKCFNYHLLPNDTYGLISYTPTGSGVDIDARDFKSGKRPDMRDKNVYFIENAEGQVTTFITCQNVTHEAAPCKQYFSLFPHMKAHISVSYRRGLLPHWKQIQKSVGELILSFETPTTSSP